MALRSDRRNLPAALARAGYQHVVDREFWRAVLKSARNAPFVEREFWRKLLKVAGRIPFAEDLAAAYFCAMDPVTPTRVKGILIAALAYFVSPIDLIPDFIAGIGFTDDAAVLAMAIGLVSRHMKPQHYERARAALGLPPQEPAKAG